MIDFIKKIFKLYFNHSLEIDPYYLGNIDEEGCIFILPEELNDV